MKNDIICMLAGWLTGIGYYYVIDEHFMSQLVLWCIASCITCLYYTIKTIKISTKQ